MFFTAKPGYRQITLPSNLGTLGCSDRRTFPQKLSFQRFEGGAGTASPSLDSPFLSTCPCPARKEKDTDQRWERCGGRWATLAARASRCWQLDRETPAGDWTTGSWPGQWCPGEIHVCELWQTFASLPHRDGKPVNFGNYRTHIGPCPGNLKEIQVKSVKPG